MGTVLIVVLAVIVAALIIWNLPRLRGQAPGRRARPRRRPFAPAPDQTGAPAHVPDDEELRMRAQAHREAAARNQREAGEIERGAAPVAPTAAPHDERY